MTLRISMMGIVLAAMLIGLPVFLWLKGELFTQLFSGAPGLIAITGIAFIGNITILLPAPALGVTMPALVAIAEQSGVVLVSALYAAGSALGESSGYMAGRKGAEIPMLGNSHWHHTLEQWLRGSRTDVVLAFLSFVPVILPFDAGGMIAGSMRHPWWRFLVATFLGRWLKYWIFIQIWHTVAALSGYFVWIIVVCAVVAIGIAAWRYRAYLSSQVSEYRRRIKKDGLHIRLERRWGW